MLEGALVIIDRGRSFTLIGRKEWFNFDQPYRHTLVCYPSNPRGYFDIDLRDEKNRARYGLDLDNCKGSLFCVEERYNRLGYRERELETPAPGPRVVFLGDSFVLGEGVKELERFSNLLYDDYWHRKVTVYNLGKCGAGVPNVLKEELPDALKFSPDIIVYCYVLNDPSLCGEIDLRKDAINDLMNMRFYNSDIYKYFDSRLDKIKEGSFRRKILLFERQALLNSRLFFLLRSIFIDRRITRETVAWYKDMYTSRNRCWEESAQMLVQMADICRRNNSDFVVAILPIFYDFKDYPFSGIHKQIADICRRNHIAVLDTLAGFRGLDYRDYIVHPLDYHPNEKANKIIAKELNSFLAERINRLTDDRANSQP